jgi:hypothetical protein
VSGESNMSKPVTFDGQNVRNTEKASWHLNCVHYTMLPLIHVDQSNKNQCPRIPQLIASPRRPMQ